MRYATINCWEFSARPSPVPLYMIKFIETRIIWGIPRKAQQEIKGVEKGANLLTTVWTLGSKGSPFLKLKTNSYEGKTSFTCTSKSY